MKLLDPNLNKLAKANMDLIHRNLFGKPLLQAKDYLIHILGKDNMAAVNTELDEFIEYMKQLYKNRPIST
jgi:hypothetical protein